MGGAKALQAVGAAPPPSTPRNARRTCMRPSSVDRRIILKCFRIQKIRKMRSAFKIRRNWTPESVFTEKWQSPRMLQAQVPCAPGVRGFEVVGVG